MGSNKLNKIFPIHLRYFLKENTLLIFHKESKIELFIHNYLQLIFLKKSKLKLIFLKKVKCH